MPISVVVADDHPIVIEGLRDLFHQENDIKILAECGTGDEALAAVRKHRPDILLLDIRMPGKNWSEVIREIQKQKLKTRVVLLTAVLDENDTLEAVRLGVPGVVLKDTLPKQLVQCVRKVHTGARWLDNNALGAALEKVAWREGGMHQVSGVLSPREIEIVRLVAAGLRNKEIGKKLFISEGTVKIHLHNIYEKLNVRSRLALSLYARDKGLV